MPTVPSNAQELLSKPKDALKALINGLAANVSSLATANNNILSAVRTLANELKADVNALRTDVSALKAAYAAAVELINECKTDGNALRADVLALPKRNLVAGAAADTPIALTPIQATDSIISVLVHDVGGAANPTDQTGATTIPSNGNVQLSVDTTGKVVEVLWRAAATSTVIAAADAADSAALTSTTVDAADVGAVSTITAAVNTSSDYS